MKIAELKEEYNRAERLYNRASDKVIWLRDRAMQATTLEEFNRYYDMLDDAVQERDSRTYDVIKSRYNLAQAEWKNR